MGFCLFYFAPPKQMMDPGQARVEENVPVKAPMTELERRKLDVPDLYEVAPAPESTVSNRPRLETMEIEPPTPVLSTEGGLTGRTAPTLQASPSRPITEPAPRRRPAVVTAPPPIPDLMP